jgi:hypothetical protein
MDRRELESLFADWLDGRESASRTLAEKYGVTVKRGAPEARRIKTFRPLSSWEVEATKSVRTFIEMMCGNGGMDDAARDLAELGLIVSLDRKVMA